MFPMEIDTTRSVFRFKCQLYGLTWVPPVRQKVIVKGGLLKDDADWSKIGLKEGQKLMMIGTADEILKAPETGPIFAENMTEEELVAAVGHSAGLMNLGNTCYMNSTVQCLHSVPELKSALIQYPYPNSYNCIDRYSNSLTLATAELFNDLDKNVKPVVPTKFLKALRKSYPQFAQFHNGVYMQQDAEECWAKLLSTLLFTLAYYKDDDISVDDPVMTLFCIDLVSRVYCAESGEEKTRTEEVYSLKCHISQEVNHLHEGLKRGLKSKLEEFSPSLGRSATYVKDSRIFILPRNVEYPLELDVYDLCSDDLQQKLRVSRRILTVGEENKLDLKANEKGSTSTHTDVKITDAEGPSSGSKDSSKSTPEEEEDKHPTGVYNLVAVLTHKGRSADSGHYVAWVKKENGKWIQFDDDNLIPQQEEDIPTLSGGRDWHTAYICMYKSREVTM
ncbi:deubiquitinating enzyme [Castilleja foliolosa]|uniref:Ubiquitin carboxyl-terminal hydrolase n=1 Tax=Castilleja foliolosa TaxID=1961234 RepID=A0ABD3CSE6_9LAMI